MIGTQAARDMLQMAKDNMEKTWQKKKDNSKLPQKVFQKKKMR